MRGSYAANGLGASILSRLVVDVVDDQSWLRAALLLEFQAKLFVDCVE